VVWHFLALVRISMFIDDMNLQQTLVKKVSTYENIDLMGNFSFMS